MEQTPRGKLPIKFVTNEGNEFDVRVTKTNKYTLWIVLIGAKPRKHIKVRKSNPRLRWE